MQQRTRKIAIRHLKTIIEPPHRSSIRVADAREATARCCIGFKHQEGLAGRQRDSACIQEGLDDVLAGIVVEVH